MKTYKTIQEWLATNPKKEETSKVLEIINRISFNEVRKSVGEKERKMRKLLRLADDFKTIEMKVPVEFEATIKTLNAEIVALRKEFPQPTKRGNKEKPTEA